DRGVDTNVRDAVRPDRSGRGVASDVGGKLHIGAGVPVAFGLASEQRAVAADTGLDPDRGRVLDDGRELLLAGLGELDGAAAGLRGQERRDRLDEKLRLGAVAAAKGGDDDANLVLRQSKEAGSHGADE